MKIEYDTLHKDRFGLGWSRFVTVDGVKYGVSVRPGKRVRLAFSKRYGYHWYATVYRYNVGAVASLRCEKRAGTKAIIEDALYFEFCRLAFGVEDIVGRMYDRAYPRGRDILRETPERVAYQRLRDVFIETRFHPL